MYKIHTVVCSPRELIQKVSVSLLPGWILEEYFLLSNNLINAYFSKILANLFTFTINLS